MERWIWFLPCPRVVPTEVSDLQPKLSHPSWLCWNSYLEGEAAAGFGSSQEDPGLVFLSPLALEKQKKNKITN